MTVAKGKKSLKAWEIVSLVLRSVSSSVKPGITTLELNKIGTALIKEHGARAVNIGYTLHNENPPYPHAMVISVNDEIGHGIADGRVLKEGDLVSIDMGVEKDGLCGDAALTVPVGEISKNDKKLLAVAKNALYEGIRAIKPGNRIHFVGAYIENYLKKEGFVVNRSFAGHTIGEEMHMDPKIPHFYAPFYRPNEVFQVGQMVCIEPMITKHDKFGYVAENKWTRKTIDGKKSAFFEHQVLVTDDGCRILTGHI